MNEPTTVILEIKKLEKKACADSSFMVSMLTAVIAIISMDSFLHILALPLFLLAGVIYSLALALLFIDIEPDDIDIAAGNSDLNDSKSESIIKRLTPALEGFFINPQWSVVLHFFLSILNILQYFAYIEAHPTQNIAIANNHYILICGVITAASIAMAGLAFLNKLTSNKITQIKAIKTGDEIK